MQIVEDLNTESLDSHSNGLEEKSMKSTRDDMLKEENKF